MLDAALPSHSAAALTIFAPRVPCVLLLLLQGMNGFVWVSARRPGAGAAAHAADATAADASLPPPPELLGNAGAAPSAEAADESTPLTYEERERVCRVRNVLVGLNQLTISISPQSVAGMYHASLSLGVVCKDMLLPSVLPQLMREAFREAPPSRVEEEDD